MSYNLALTCLEGAVKIRKYQVSRLKSTTELASIYEEECALGADFYNLGNVHMQMADYGQAMQCFIQSRDLRWCHVGSGTVDNILEKYFSSSLIDEDELLGLGEIRKAGHSLLLLKFASHHYIHFNQLIVFIILELCSTSKRITSDHYLTTKRH